MKYMHRIRTSDQRDGIDQKRKSETVWATRPEEDGYGIYAKKTSYMPYKKCFNINEPDLQ